MKFISKLCEEKSFQNFAQEKSFQIFVQGIFFSNKSKHHNSFENTYVKIFEKVQKHKNPNRSQRPTKSQGPKFVKNNNVVIFPQVQKNDQKLKKITIENTIVVSQTDEVNEK